MAARGPVDNRSISRKFKMVEASMRLKWPSLISRFPLICLTHQRLHIIQTVLKCPISDCWWGGDIFWNLFHLKSNIYSPKSILLGKNWPYGSFQTVPLCDMLNGFMYRSNQKYKFPHFESLESIVIIYGVEWLSQDCLKLHWLQCHLITTAYLLLIFYPMSSAPIDRWVAVWIKTEKSGWFMVKESKGGGEIHPGIRKCACLPIVLNCGCLQTSGVWPMHLASLSRMLLPMQS